MACFVPWGSACYILAVSSGMHAATSPPETVERWCRNYIEATDLSVKLHPPRVPSDWQVSAITDVSELRPGRPACFVIESSGARTPKPGALVQPRKRAQLMHTFLHHELQAAELMAWAVLRFPDTPRAFRRGLLGVLMDEVRHMGMYLGYLESLGFAAGSFPVRDWFWERIPTAETPAAFAAVMSMGFEAGNLDHTQRFSDALRMAGDSDGAALLDVVGREEIRHVRFGVSWFRHFAQAFSFDEWRQQLPKPLSPMLMRGRPLNFDARREAGFDDDFLQALDTWKPVAPGF